MILTNTFGYLNVVVNSFIQVYTNASFYLLKSIISVSVKEKN